MASYNKNSQEMKLENLSFEEGIKESGNFQQAIRSVLLVMVGADLQNHASH